MSVNIYCNIITEIKKAIVTFPELRNMVWHDLLHSCVVLVRSHSFLRSCMTMFCNMLHSLPIEYAYSLHPWSYGYVPVYLFAHRWACRHRLAPTLCPVGLRILDLFVFSASIEKSEQNAMKCSITYNVNIKNPFSIFFSYRYFHILS